jgi:uncharacterized damage-inducible protein DinB
MQNNQQFFAHRLKNEIPGFVKMIRALPADKLDYRPHEKNTPAGTLALQIVSEMEALIGLFENGAIAMSGYGDVPPIEELATRFERAANTVAERATAIDDAGWNAPGKFSFGGHVAWEAPALDLAWGFLFDLVHHRGQLSAYLRPMGGKVPAIYGPSADDRG